MVIVAVVGLPGCGKSEVIKVFKDAGWTNVYCGDAIFQEMQRRGLEVTEENERLVREELRAEHGINAIEHVAIPLVQAAARNGDVTVESFYTWESYAEYSDVFGHDFRVLAVHASPATRAARLAARKQRPLSPAMTRSRTHSQISNLHQAGPIAIADFHVVNEGTLEDLRGAVKRVIESLSV